MSKLQDDVFRQGESDAWFRRNQEALTDADRVRDDVPLQLVSLFSLQPRHILEVGCADGWRLEQLRQRTSAECVGVEPSALAVEAGKERYPEIGLRQGMAHELPFDDGRFDLVVLAFVMHWIDRRRLLRVAAEIDRVLEDGGHLIVWDFLPVHPSRTRYHHRPDEHVFTYKQDHAALWAATGCYRRVASLSSDYRTARFSTDAAPNDNLGCTLLKKDLEHGFVEFPWVEGHAK